MPPPAERRSPPLLPLTLGPDSEANVTDLPDLTGTRLQVDGLVGRGGMGTVVQAYDLDLQRHVAVKVLRAELAGRPGEFESFLREARITAALEHPNIVPVHSAAWDYGTNSGGFQMKLVRGESLAKHLADLGAGRLDERQLPTLLQVLLKVCDAVAFAHSQRVLHLDLKPENVMIGSHGQVYVMDWGISVRCNLDADGHLRADAAMSGVRGSPGYMAPEQRSLGYAGVDERSDVYSLGAILYEILSGRPPRRDEVIRSWPREELMTDADASSESWDVPPGLIDCADGPASRARTAHGEGGGLQARHRAVHARRRLVPRAHVPAR